MDRRTIGADEVCIILPPSLASGEPGEALSPVTGAIITKMAELSYAPLDFGEDMGDGGTELWFFTTQPDLAKDMAQRFIDNGGAE